MSAPEQPKKTYRKRKRPNYQYVWKSIFKVKGPLREVAFCPFGEHTNLFATAGKNIISVFDSTEESKSFPVFWELFLFFFYILRILKSFFMSWHSTGSFYDGWSWRWRIFCPWMVHLGWISFHCCRWSSWFIKGHWPYIRRLTGDDLLLFFKQFLLLWDQQGISKICLTLFPQ